MRLVSQLRKEENKENKPSKYYKDVYLSYFRNSINVPKSYWSLLVIIIHQPIQPINKYYWKKAYCLIISITLNGLEGLYKKIGIGPEIESD